jgi:diguanylate cyclase
MMNSRDDEKKKIFEKSIKLLDNSQSQLKEIRQALRKAVVRLSLAARSTDGQMNTVLDEIQASVSDEICIPVLDAQLDDLFVLMNRDDVSADIVHPADENDDLEADVRLFADRLKQALDLQADNHASRNTPDILADLTEEILQRVNVLKMTADNSDSSNTHENLDKFSSVLIDLVSHLTLSNDVRDEQQALVKQLDTSRNSPREWKGVIEGVVSLVNKSIETLEAEKHELEVFIEKITVQLAEIEEYVHETNKDRTESVAQTVLLKNTVDASVGEMKKEVDESDDINQLKEGVNKHLSSIRKNVEEHVKSEQRKDNASHVGYDKVINELTESQREVQKLQEQLHENQCKLLRDPLTGLPNRLAYNERIAAEMYRWNRTQSPLSLAVWDIDKFKTINDTYGHDAGDRVLKLFAQIISSRIRKVDLFARIGGEEFVLLMPDTSLEAALDLNNRLRVNLENSGFHYKGNACPITASVGIASFDVGDTAESVMKQADGALYESKNSGRNRCTLFQSVLSS